MISKTIGCRGTLFSDKPIAGFPHVFCVEATEIAETCDSDSPQICFERQLANAKLWSCDDASFGRQWSNTLRNISSTMASWAETLLFCCNLKRSRKMPLQSIVHFYLGCVSPSFGPMAPKWLSDEAKSLRTADITCATTSVAAAVGRVRWSP